MINMPTKLSHKYLLIQELNKRNIEYVEVPSLIMIGNGVPGVCVGKEPLKLYTFNFDYHGNFLINN